jgi:hypothetical protein
MQKTLAALVFGVVLASLSLVPALAGESPRPENPVAQVNVGPTSVAWSPAVAYERLVLTVVGPEGFENRQELEAGQNPSLTLFKPNGERLADGVYRYELRLLPRTVAGTKNLTDKAVQTGGLWVRDGAFVTPTFDKNPVASPPSSKRPQIRNITEKDSVVSDDLVVQGTACIGPYCVNGDPDANTLKLKDRLPRIYFDDVFSGGFPARDWVLQANTADPADYFILQDSPPLGPIPFVVHGGSPNDTLVVASGGFDAQERRVGIGTSLPLKNLHVVNATTPTIRLEQPVSPGPARIWDVGASNTQFFVSDITASSSVPFKILAGAPSDSLVVTGAGNIGIGTASPATQFHLRGTDAGSRNKILVENAGTTNFREMLEIRNNGGPVFILKDMTVPQRWGIGTLGSSLVIDNQANPGIELSLSSTGNLTISGIYSPSDRSLKKDIVPVSHENVLAKLAALPIATWTYKTDDVRHIGPMAQDFAVAFGLGIDDKHISPNDMAGVSMAAVQGLNQVLQNKAEEIATLQRENAGLAKRVEALEALLSTLMDQKHAPAQAEPAP